ncbi:MAG TPA: histidine phosphatase family protein [Cyclobacteriaceae bacterium]|nr:histidine phosphatase family protein [Cyclobacteriaceae bacterium]
MKTIFLVRHAKSSWDFPNLSDFDRPLNNRGLRNAPEMGARLKAKGVYPDAVISSPARRAQDTCRIICREIAFPESNIEFNRNLYDGDEDDILDVIQKIPDNVDSVFIVTHNPGITFFVNEMVEEDIDNVPTCGIVAITFETNSWKELDFGQGELLFFDYPKKKEN